MQHAQILSKLGRLAPQEVQVCHPWGADVELYVRRLNHEKAQDVDALTRQTNINAKIAEAREEARSRIIEKRKAEGVEGTAVEPTSADLHTDAEYVRTSAEIIASMRVTVQEEREGAACRLIAKWKIGDETTVSDPETARKEFFAVLEDDGDEAVIPPFLALVGTKVDKLPKLGDPLPEGCEYGPLDAEQYEAAMEVCAELTRRSQDLAQRINETEDAEQGKFWKDRHRCRKCNTRRVKAGQCDKCKGKTEPMLYGELDGVEQKEANAIDKRLEKGREKAVDELRCWGEQALLEIGVVATPGAEKVSHNVPSQTPARVAMANYVLQVAAEAEEAYQSITVPLGASSARRSVSTPRMAKRKRRTSKRSATRR
jgi:hypothetical protein